MVEFNSDFLALILANDSSLDEVSSFTGSQLNALRLTIAWQ